MNIKIKNLNFLTIIFLLFSFFNFTQAYSQVDSVENAISKDYNLVKHFAREANVRNYKDYAPINEYMQIVAYFETRIQNDTRNSCYRGGVNTAKGYFQFIDPTYWWIYDTIRGKVIDDDGNREDGIMSSFPYGRYIYEYSYAGQAQFAITLWNEMAERNNWQEEMMKGLYNRDYEVGFKVYCKYHHTDCASQLSPTRYKELKDALHNWEKDLYHMTPEKWEKLRKEEEERLRKLKKKLENKIKEIKSKLEKLLEEKKEKEKSRKLSKANKPKEKSKKIEENQDTENTEQTGSIEENNNSENNSEEGNNGDEN